VSSYSIILSKLLCKNMSRGKRKLVAKAQAPFTDACNQHDGQQQESVDCKDCIPGQFGMQNDAQAKRLGYTGKVDKALH
jgi:hypothetical protein